MTVYPGILTGISYVSGLDYYRGIHERVLAATPVGHLMPPNPSLAMVSVDCDEYAFHLTNRNFDRVAALLLEGVDKLVATGCGLLIIASNTGHICVPVVEAEYPDLDILHIADCSAYQLKELGISQVGLVGTRPTMEESYLRDRLARHGIATVIPKEVSAREEIYRIIYQELSLNEFRPESRATIVDTIRALGATGVQACLLGCTEIELLVQQEHVPELPLLMSAETHIQFAAEILLGNLAVEDVLPAKTM
ncbi:MAG: aspartate/glutamate racemase family protein [Acidimicrobiales bacterium]|jgi:aspartate racemase